jgi:5'-3' exonuclease
MLLDTASLYFRAYYGVPESTVAPDGTPVNAVRGLLDFIRRLVDDHSPTHLIACWDDDWRPEFRVAAIPSYKAHRVVEQGSDDEEIPDTLAPQIPIIIDVLEALGIPRVGVPGFEADDVIATYATQSDMPVDIVTGDRDLFQLVNDNLDRRVIYTARSVSRPDIYTEAVIAEKYAIPGDRYADFAILRGDPSDGLPGVKGIGEKTAATLVTEHGSIDGIRAAALDPEANMAKGVRAKIIEHEAYLDVAPLVVSTVIDVPVPTVESRISVAPVDAQRYAQLTDTWGLGSSASRAANSLTKAAQSTD